jgi:hypothetical protein
MGRFWLGFIAALLASSPVSAQDHAGHTASRPAAATATRSIPAAAEQIAGAVMAAPEEFRPGARVYGYGPDGKFVELRKGTNEMVCLADDPAESPRWHVACYHAGLEPFMARGRELTAQGITGDRRDALRNADVDAGRIKMPVAGGLYTVTARAGCYNPARGTMCPRAEPLHSVYVPYATPASTGLLEHPTDEHTPWLMSPGTPRAHIMFGKHEHH